MMNLSAPTTWSSRRGMTLTEILITMMVLLVGIYTVARGFPLMLMNIRGEGERTSMARLAEQAMARLSDNQYGLPDAITGGGSVSHYTFAQDLTAPHVERNAQEDIIEVRGETFRVPAPYRSPGGAYTGAPAWYALSQGPAAYTAGYPYVYMLVPLQERPDDPRTAGAVDYPGNWFYVDKDRGQIVVPVDVTTAEGGANSRTWTVTNVTVDYTWTTRETGGPPYALPIMHYVQGEVPSDVTNYPSSGSAQYRECTVHPAHASGGAIDGNVRLVAGQTRAWARVEFGRNVGTATPPAGSFTLEPRYGVTLGFHPADAGLTLKVDYQLRTTQGTDDAFPRRLLLMTEEQTIQADTNRVDASAVPYADIRLAMRGIDDEPVFRTDVQGNPLPGNATVHILAVDLSTGQTYTDGNPMILDDPGMQPELMDGYQNGLVAVPLQIGGVPADYIGHVWRFYYRTLDRHNIQVQKAPRSYVDAETAQRYLAGFLPPAQAANEAASLADVDYRTYRLTHQALPGATDGRQVAVIEFGQWLTGGTFTEAESTSGFTVAVNYAYWADANTRRVVYGELHTVSPDGRSVVLNHPTVDASHPFEIMAVNGVSARARGWWLARNGRQRQLDVETVFLTSPLGLLPTVR